MTPAQLTTLKAAIAADPVLAAYPDTSDGAFDMALYLGTASSPTFVVWRTNVTRDEVTSEGFDWTQVDNLTTGQARIWDLLFDNQSRAINAGDAGKRAGLAECWKGTAAKLAVGTFVLSRCKRPATRGERLFATGTGSDASPGSLVIEGAIGYQDIMAARAL